jgi:outer membrane protein assembly factor BamB
MKKQPMASSPCIGLAALLVWLLSGTATALAKDWPQWRGPNRDGVWSEKGILDTFPPGGLKIRWCAPVGIGFSSPVVARGRVYVSDSQLANPKAQERVHAFDAVTGKPIWSYTYEVNYPALAFDKNYPRGPIATPVVADRRIYTFGAAGHLFCFDAAKGHALWERDVQKEHPASQLYTSASPLIEGELLIVLVGAKPGACVIAFDKRTGKEAWASLDEPASASSPIVITAGGARQLIVWTEQSVTALDPKTGKTYWRQHLDITQDAAVSTPAYHGGYLLVLIEAVVREVQPAKRGHLLYTTSAPC